MVIADQCKQLIATHFLNVIQVCGPMQLDPVKIVKCKNCGADVIVNANYPVTSVEKCKNCGLYGTTNKTWNTWKNN